MTSLTLKYFVTLILTSSLCAADECPSCGSSLEFSDGVSLLQTGIDHRSSGHMRASAEGVVEQDDYLWPSGIGHFSAYTSSVSKAPRNLNESLAWSWFHPDGRYRAVPGGATIDGQKNIYLHALDGIRKFTSEGEILWSYTPVREEGEEMPDMSSLYQGAVYTSTTHGRIIAISMETGEELWTTKLPSTDGNNGWVSVDGGIVLTGSDARDENRGQPAGGRYADQYVTGLNATDGQVLWNFKPDAPVWNFLGSFAGDGTITFQDYEGRAYRCNAIDGTLIWKNGGINNSWTDGSSLLGPNKVVYTVGNGDCLQTANCPYGGGRDGHGWVTAYNLEDGELLWQTEVPRPPNNLPAIGRLAGRTGLSLVQPIGQQCSAGNPTDIYALDAETGELQWIFNGPTQQLELQAGDANLEAQAQRQLSGVRAITLPNPWSAPTIDGDGVVFIGSEEGPFFALADTDGDGTVLGENEVSSFETGSCFSGSTAAAIAPGMIVATNIDTMYVFKL